MIKMAKISMNKTSIGFLLDELGDIFSSCFELMTIPACKLLNRSVYKF